jgi:3-oxoacyl-[acyl-carrier-protein] synthase II
MTSTRCRPFDERRDGMQLGEAAAILHIESRSHARARGAETLAIVEGWGFSGDAHHAVAPRPDGSGMAAAMTACLAHARVAPEEVDWVCAHGTGTPRSDTAEARAITSCFAPSPPPVGSVKGALGHSMGASSAVEAIISVQALHHQIIPPTAGLGAPDRELGLRLPREAAPMRLERVISPAYAFGGLNSALLLRAP